MYDFSAIHLGPLARPARVIRNYLPPINFITLHYAYFIGTCLLFAIIFWGSSTPARSVSFTDSLFLCVSAMSLAGLNTVNLSTLNTFQQFIMFLLIMLGSAIFVSAFVVSFRKHAFVRKFESVINKRKSKLRRTGSFGTLPFAKSFSRGRDRDRDRDPTFPKTDAKRPNDESSSSKDLPGVSSSDFGAEDSQMVPPDDGNVESGVQLRTMSTTSSQQQAKNQATTSSSDQGRSGIGLQIPAREDSISRSRVAFSPDTRFRHGGPGEHDQFQRQRTRRSSFTSMTGVGAVPIQRARPLVVRPYTPAEQNELLSGIAKATRKYFPSTGFISRNSQFHGLTEAEREKLGGVEYRALEWLSWLVPLYFILIQFLSCLGLAAWVAHHRASAALENGLNPWWVGAFNAVSAFNNSGMSLLDANMVAFQDAYYVLLSMGFLILAGNTCYPIFLRIIIWTLYQLMPDHDSWAEHKNTLRFLLDHPRRCYTNLFPARHTWWLGWAVITLNGIDWAAFEILNIGNDALEAAVPGNHRVIDGLFQAFAVRSGGFYVVSITSVRISLQVLYVVMMYISVYPVVITMRNSNVYEERSLGIYADDPQYEQASADDGGASRSFWGSVSGLKRRLTNVQETKSYFVSQQIRAQLAHDTWWIVLAIFLIMIIEGGQFEQNPAVFSVFNVIFEVVSAYGTVGISVGVPWAAYSFSGAWHTLSKLILCAVMLRGRHRGLPVAIDKAVLLPGEKSDHAEEEDATIRMERAASRGRGEETA